jgi:hypothetical protein
MCEDRHVCLVFCRTCIEDPSEQRQRPQTYGENLVPTRRSTTTRSSSKARYLREHRLLDTNQRFRDILRGQTVKGADNWQLFSDSFTIQEKDLRHRRR